MTGSTTTSLGEALIFEVVPGALPDHQEGERPSEVLFCQAWFCWGLMGGLAGLREAGFQFANLRL